MSAIADSNDGPNEVIKVLFTLYPGYNTLDVAGPLEMLSRALHDPKDKGAFNPVRCLAHCHVQTAAIGSIGSTCT